MKTTSKIQTTSKMKMTSKYRQPQKLCLVSKVGFGRLGLVWFDLGWFGLVWCGFVGLVWYEDGIKKGRLP